MKKRKKGSGGSRKRAGRKKGEPNTTISVFIKLKQKENILKYINSKELTKQIKEFLINLEKKLIE